MFKLIEESKIYIVAPPSYASGGPELLHQLCAALCQRGFDAKMYYCDKFKGHENYENPVPDRFLIYNTTFVNEVEDDENNLLIVPETVNTELIKFKHIQKCMWWLGANNYFWLKEINSHKYLTFLYHWSHRLLRRPTPLTFNQIKNANAVHLAQCWYAVSYLEKKGLHNIAYLSDYLADRYITERLDDYPKRHNVILYNPSRNVKFIHLLQKANPSLKFVAIKNMSPDEVVDLMRKSKLYIDFGAHPGKDRMPREAVMCGCCIIVSTLGSADFFDDMPIPLEYKFERKRKNIPLIMDKIMSIFQNYDEERQNFEYYKKYILQEKNQFESDIDKLFVLKKNRRE
ncbi:MAG: hypothetical protein PHG07_00870 [Lachnospiraceae bacterium]|nr:hypothetical protein [Lachnospiraceae bacterium]